MTLTTSKEFCQIHPPTEIKTKHIYLLFVVIVSMVSLVAPLLYCTTYYLYINQQQATQTESYRHCSNTSSARPFNRYNRAMPGSFIMKNNFSHVIFFKIFKAFFGSQKLCVLYFKISVSVWALFVMALTI